MLHYRNTAEAISDRAQLLFLLEAADITPHALVHDRCGQWVIKGKRGYASTWGDGKAWLVYAEQRSSPLAWTWAKKRMSAFAVVTQDGDDEGVFRLDALPTPEQAETLRDIIGFRRRTEYSPEELERRRAWVQDRRLPPTAEPA
jgi:hypothetical protein